MIDSDVNCTKKKKKTHNDYALKPVASSVLHSAKSERDARTLLGFVYFNSRCARASFVQMNRRITVSLLSHVPRVRIVCTGNSGV